MANPSESQLGAPLEATYQKGRYTLNRIYVVDTTAAEGATTATELTSIVAIDVGEPSWDEENTAFQQGGGDEKTMIRRGPRWDGTVTVLSGKVSDVLASLQNVTWAAGGQVAMPLRTSNDNPAIIWEAICRDADNTDHLFSLVIQDMIIDNLAFTNPMEYSERTIPFHTYHDPFTLKADHELVYDTYTATPTTETYTLSCSTPATLVTATDHDDWYFDNAVYIKLKDNSDDDRMKRLTTGVSISGATVTFVTGTPDATDKLMVLYAKSSA